MNSVQFHSNVALLAAPRGRTKAGCVLLVEVLQSTARNVLVACFTSEAMEDLGWLFRFETCDGLSVICFYAKCIGGRRRISPPKRHLHEHGRVGVAVVVSATQCLYTAALSATTEEVALDAENRHGFCAKGPRISVRTSLRAVQLDTGGWGGGNPWSSGPAIKPRSSGRGRSCSFAFER